MSKKVCQDCKIENTDWKKSQVILHTRHFKYCRDLNFRKMLLNAGARKKGVKLRRLQKSWFRLEERISGRSVRPTPKSSNSCTCLCSNKLKQKWKTKKVILKNGQSWLFYFIKYILTVLIICYGLYISMISLYKEMFLIVLTE